MIIRKYRWQLIVAFLVITTILIVNVLSPSQNIKISYVDGNQTKITNSVVFKREHRLFPTIIRAPKISGYRTNKNVVFITSKMKQITFQYFPRKANPKQVLAGKKYVATAFQVMDKEVSGGEQTDSYEDRMRIIYSNNGKEWHRLAVDYPNIMIRDPSMIHVGKWWYVIATNRVFLRTSDFKHWHKLNWYDGTTKFGAIWAPSFFKDKDGNAHIVCSATYPGQSNFQIFVSDFDTEKGSMVGNWRKVTGGYLDQLDNSGVIDPHITVINNKYYLWCVRRDDTDLLMLVSDNNFDAFTNRDVKLTPPKKTVNDAYEAPATSIFKENSVLLYYDQYRQNKSKFIYSGEHVRELELDGMQLSNSKPVSSDFLIRHMNFVVR
ncbi:hypothetical protein DA798_10215 [Lactobacillus sp. PFC-70]|nr:hypothetical protein DA798_10215 [Lactobacillus sp. PFC-70]